MPGKVLRHLFGRHAPVRLGAPLDAGARWRWMWRWWRACRPRRATRPTAARMHRLARFSRERLHALTRDLQLDYERSAAATWCCCAARRDLALAQRRPAAAGASCGVRLRAARRRPVPRRSSRPERRHAAARRHPPAATTRSATAASSPMLLQGAGAARWARRFRFQHDGASAPARAGRAPAAAARATARSCRRRQPPRPHGQAPSASTPWWCAPALGRTALLRAARPAPAAASRCTATRSPRRCATSKAIRDLGPRAALMDERYKVAISRLGKRVRVAGSAEIGGTLETHQRRRAGHAVQGARRLVPRRGPAAARRSAGKARGRCCPTARRCSGASGAAGVWLNLGHGSSGWALACGSARVLADLMARPRAGRSTSTAWASSGCS